jgi:hypothetical protein
MSDSSNAGFGKFVPGFDFLQNIAKGASQNIPQLPNLSNWVAPTLNVEELDKRIEELKAVHFWLDQNSKALAATIQALEVQKMTLATLKGMNFNMGDVANALKLKAADAMAAGAQKVSEKAQKSGVVDPMQWWGSLTQQFQQIAAGAMKDVARQNTLDATKNIAKGAFKTATGMAKAATTSVGARSDKSSYTSTRSAPAKVAKKAATASRKRASPRS